MYKVVVKRFISVVKKKKKTINVDFWKSVLIRFLLKSLKSCPSALLLVGSKSDNSPSVATS